MKQNPYYIFFMNLANPLKISVISALKERDMNVTRLSKELKVEQSKHSHALSALKHCNIVHYKKEGKQRIYSLNKETILPMLKLTDKHAKHFCKKKSCGC
jgi:DNA-binding transcriptional ArsR family regulator